MRPISIRFRCFGPYMDEQFLDFTQLEPSGVFLICGETGAGKTTILDAMCYALYGESSGGLRGDMEIMRCKLAGDKDETHVEFVFESGGRTYMFTRSLKKKRTVLHAYHNCMELLDGEFVPIFPNPKAKQVNGKAKELLGLDVNQFRQVIVLPQGQFERLLVSDSAEKEKILETLFHADRWKRITDHITAHVAEQNARLKEEQGRIALKYAEYGCDGPASLAEKAAQARALRQALTLRRDEAKEALEALRQRHAQALLENQDFEELAKRQSRLDKLTPQEGWAAQEAQVLNRAELARQLQPRYLRHQQAKSAYDQGANALAAAQLRAEKADAALTQARQAYETHQAGRPQYEEMKKELTLLEASAELYQSLTRLQTGAEEANRRLTTAQKALTKAQRSLADRDKALKDAEDTQDQAMAVCRQARLTYRLGIGGILAADLAAGEPCPVCGSREHPCPAQAPSGHVTDGELDELEKAMKDATDTLSAARKAREQAEALRAQAQDAFSLAQQDAALKNRDWQDALTRRLPGIENDEQLAARTELVRQAIQTYETRDAAVSQALTDAQGDRKAALAAHETAAEALARAELAYREEEAIWQAALEESGFEAPGQYAGAIMEPAEEKRRREALTAYRADLSHARADLAEQREKLTGREKPEPEALRALTEQQETLHEEVIRQLALTERQLEAMDRDGADLALRQERLSRERLELEEDTAFALRLSGRSGVSLQRYVLGVMLSSITAEANRLLERIYGGRYRLYRTDEVAGSGRKSGLELEVFDSANSQRRSVTTLSGGEKFLVALSLAIGLSTVVQARSGGMRLEAMFVDEGFGSLDRESVGDALEVLQSIGKTAGLVGVISHVEQLSEVIATRVEVKKGPRGSRFRVLEG